MDKQLQEKFEQVLNLFSEDEYEILSSILKALAHPTRLKIVTLLYLAKNHKVCVSNIVDLLDIPQPNISQHLFILKSAGIVSCERHKNFVCYTLNDGLAKKIIELLINDKSCFSSPLEEKKDKEENL
jgi:ArsR family transcriptional regulator